MVEFGESQKRIRLWMFYTVVQNIKKLSFYQCQFINLCNFEIVHCDYMLIKYPPLLWNLRIKKSSSTHIKLNTLDDEIFLI